MTGPPEDNRPRWERAAEERRSRAGLGLPADFTMPKWLPAVLFVVLLGSSMKRLVQADDALHAVWAVASALLFIFVLIAFLRRNYRK